MISILDHEQIRFDSIMPWYLTAPLLSPLDQTEKLIKDLPSVVPDESETKNGSGSTKTVADSQPQESSAEPFQSSKSDKEEQQHGDQTEEVKPSPSAPAQHQSLGGADDLPGSVVQKKDELGKSKGEIAFFKLLHAEFRKAVFFFEKAQMEFEIREERVREGFQIMKQPGAIMVNEKWAMMAKSVFKLYRELLLIETYAIMTYCAFSKILKKHDKWTGHKTRGPFMTNVVHKANFTHYPKVLEMISRCEKLYEEVSQRLLEEGKQGLYEDERLFINMINRLNDQVLTTPDGEGAAAQARKNDIRLDVGAQESKNAAKAESQEVSTLRSMLEENAHRANAAQVSEDPDAQDRKRGIPTTGTKDAKRVRMST